jgi:predicted transcriptional regulator
VLSKQRRSKLEIYNDILNGIQKEAQEGEIKPTRIQHHSNMSYDKMSKYLKELESKKMITISPIQLTEKGEKFLNDYEKIKEFLSNMKIEYLKEESNDE